MLSGWLMTLAVIIGADVGFFHRADRWIAADRRTQGQRQRRVVEDCRSRCGRPADARSARLISGFERLFADHTIFTGVSYTDAHVT